MQIAHATNSLSRTGGGTSHVVWGLAIEQQAAGHDVSVLGLGNNFDSQDWPSERKENMSIRTYYRNKPRGFSWSRDLHRDLLSPVMGGSMDMIHQHGIWSMLSYSVSRWRKRWDRPSIVASHGMLRERGLKNKWWKKKLFAMLCERDNLRSSSCLHALCRVEAESMRDFGLKNPIAVIPNGIRLESYANLPEKSLFAERFPQCKGRPLLLYIGRITQLKGVSHLLDAWQRLEKHRRDGWLLVVAGPNQDGYEDTMKQKCTALGLDRDVLFPGSLYGAAKAEALSAASACVLPSFTEGFPISLLEAMACKLPLVITRECNLDEVDKVGAGWVGHPDADSMSELLDSALSRTVEERRRIGLQGYELVRHKYSWNHISRQMLQVYQWLITGGSLPPCVEAGLSGNRGS